MTDETKRELFDEIPSPYSSAQMQWIARELERVRRKCKTTPEFLAEALFAISKLAALSAGACARELNADTADVIKTLAADYQLMKRQYDENKAMHERLDVLEARLGLLELRRKDRDAA